MCNGESLYITQSEFAGERKSSTVVNAGQCAKWLLDGRFSTRVWGAIFAKYAIDNLRFHTGIRNCEDKLFLFSFLMNNDSDNVAYSSSRLYGYTVNRANSATNSIWNGRMDVVLVSDIMDKIVTTDNPEWRAQSNKNRIVSRLDVMKNIVKTRNGSKDAKIVFNKIRAEVNSIEKPYDLRFRTRIELLALSIGKPAYIVLIKLFYFFVSDKARNRGQEKQKVSICK